MIREVRKTDYLNFVDICESAVLSTHDFLKQEDLLYYGAHLLSIFSRFSCMDLSKTVVRSDL